MNQKSQMFLINRIGGSMNPDLFKSSQISWTKLLLAWTVCLKTNHSLCMYPICKDKKKKLL